MSDTYDGTTELRVPDYAETRLAFRVWSWNPGSFLLGSVNAGSAPRRRNNWIAQALAAPDGFWPPGERLTATCRLDKKHEDGIPDAECSCGYYSTTSLDVIESYLRKDAPVMGIVEMGGRVIPATQGFRAQSVTVKAILLIDEVLTLPHPTLRKIAATYGVPAIRPHSTSAEDYRLGDLDAELRRLTDGYDDDGAVAL